MMNMPHWPMTPWHKKDNDLTNILKLLRKLGNPHLKLPPVIHVAGTNGKGSSCAYLRAIFASAGFKVHVYTSPHLVDFNERIVLAGEKIADDYLFEIAEKTRLASIQAQIEPTFFEGVTAMAFLAFSEVTADILILETGIGGRLDATNVIATPLLTLITPISYDHMDMLGPTLAMIAAEKAGIIKASSPCVISCQTDEVYEVLLSKCNELGAPAFCYEYDFGITKTATGFVYSARALEMEFPAPSLLGDHQLINAGAVIAAISLINKDFNITPEHIATSLKNTNWPGRIQKIEPAKYEHLIGDNVSIWLDGAHNSAGAMVLANWVKDNLKGPLYLILGMTKNRDIEEFCSHFKGMLTKGFGVRVLSEVSSYTALVVSDRASAIEIDFASAESIEEAISEISQINGSTANIIITGSLFLVADFLKAMG